MATVDPIAPVTGTQPAAARAVPLASIRACRRTGCVVDDNYLDRSCCLTEKCYPIASCGVLPNLFRSSISNQSHPGHPCGGEAVAQSPRPKAGEKSVAGGCCGSVIRLMSSWSLTGQFLLSPVAGL